MIAMSAPLPVSPLAWATSAPSGRNSPRERLRQRFDGSFVLDVADARIVPEGRDRLVGESTRDDLADPAEVEFVRDFECGPARGREAGVRRQSNDLPIGRYLCCDCPRHSRGRDARNGVAEYATASDVIV